MHLLFYSYIFYAIIILFISYFIRLLFINFYCIYHLLFYSFIIHLFIFLFINKIISFIYYFIYLLFAFTILNTHKLCTYPSIIVIHRLPERSILMLNSK